MGVEGRREGGKEAGSAESAVADTGMVSFYL